MIITLPKLAEGLEAARSNFIAKHDQTDRHLMAGGFLMISYILQAFGQKTHLEPISGAFERMKQSVPTFDLLNDADRQLLALMLKQMYGPLGVQDVVLLGVTGERKVFITTMHSEADVKADIDEVKRLLRAIADSDDAEDFSL